MSININDPAYSTLNTYAVMSATGISTTDTTTINSGKYGASNSAITGPGTFVGVLDNSTAPAPTELGALIGAINGLTVPTPVTIPATYGQVTVTYTPGIYKSTSTIIYTNTTIILDAQGISDAQFFFIAVDNIDFKDVPSITLTGGATNCNVFWLAGTAITFTGTMPTPSIPGIFIAATLISFDAGCTVLGRLYAGTAITFIGDSRVDAQCNVVCYLKGTLILTPEGFAPIENIKAGDKVVTKGKIHKNKFIDNYSPLKVEPVMWISKFKVIDFNSKSRPICIKKNALGKNYPFKDLYVSPGHSLLLNGKMVLAKNIVNGETIYQDKECDDIVYYHLECEQHSAIIANGVLSESYLDVNNRDVFENSIKLRRKFDLRKMCDLR